MAVHSFAHLVIQWALEKTPASLKVTTNLLPRELEGTSEEVLRACCECRWQPGPAEGPAVSRAVTLRLRLSHSLPPGDMRDGQCCPSQAAG
jgi:hypothetical protein